MMKQFILGSVLGFAVLATAVDAQADVRVRGYLRSDGGYVQSHFRTNNDGYCWNNYTTRGNTNPYTGSRGYRDSAPVYGNY